MTQSDGEWTGTEIASVIGYRYGCGRREFDGSLLMAEFGVGGRMVICLFNALKAVPGLSVVCDGGGTNGGNVYTLDGVPVKGGTMRGDRDARAIAFVLGWLLATRTWFTLSEAREWTGDSRQNIIQLADVRLRYLPIWRVTRRAPSAETLFVSIA